MTGDLSASFSFEPSQLLAHSLDPTRSILPSSPRLNRTHPLSHTLNAGDFTNNTSTQLEEDEWTLVDRMRLWRHDAMMQHLYPTAAFWGDKILSWTNNANDAFWLAQTYFLMHQYSRAERLLSRPFPVPSDIPESPEIRQRVLSMTQLDAKGVSEGEGPGKGKQKDENVPSKLIQKTRFQRSRHSSLVNLPPIDMDGSTIATTSTATPAASSTPLPPLQSFGSRVQTNFMSPLFKTTAGSNLGSIGSLPGADPLFSGIPFPAGPSTSTAKFPSMDNTNTNHVDIPLEFNTRQEVLGAGSVIGLQPGWARLVDTSVACRCLAAQCQMRQGKWSEALEMLGEANPFRGTARSGPRVPNVDGGIKIEASMCHLRGLLMLKLSRTQAAKECFMEALALDVKCYDAFEQLVNGEMMTVDEEWEFIQSLSYAWQLHEEPNTSSQPQAISTPDAEFLLQIYTSRLRKFKYQDAHARAREKLVRDFGLGDNPDVLWSFADELYVQGRWRDCVVVTNRILELTALHNPTLPLHIACTYHLPHLNPKLFVLAHEMVHSEPENALSWYAVGVWYLCKKKWSDARLYFSKTSLMDPRFAPAWIAFGHSFTFEGEHDHAITAYSTCARLFTGTHLPMLFLGMEHLTLSNFPLAEETLNAAQDMCDSDPLLYNEKGVLAVNRGDFDQAVELFQRAIDLAKVTQASQDAWATTYVNLGTALHKAGRLEEARDMYKKVIEMDPRHFTALVFLGKVYHMLDDIDAAIVKYHEALSIDPINPHVVELLNLALEASADLPIFRRHKKLDFANSVNGVTKKGFGVSTISGGRGTPGDSSMNRSIDDEMVVG